MYGIFDNFWYKYKLKYYSFVRIIYTYMHANSKLVVVI